jgi:hypothetical protein
MGLKGYRLYGSWVNLIQRAEPHLEGAVDVDEEQDAAEA